MFSAEADGTVLDQIRILIDPYLGDNERVTAVIRAAEASGFQFDD
jgi:hypothetical protein